MKTSHPGMLLTAVRVGFFLAAAVACVLAIGLLLQQAWATSVWPWPTGRLSYMFLASILAAIAAPMFWVATTAEWGAAAGSALFPSILFSALGVQGFRSAIVIGRALPFILLSALLAIISLAIYLWSRRIPLRDTRPAPRVLMWSFAVFVAVLVLSGAALAIARPNIMPWPVRAETSIGFGWVFLGAASSYAYAIRHPWWHHARGPLLGFLVYDLVLLLPLVNLFSTGRPELRINLIVYTVVVVYSALLGLYYLIIHPGTRGWAAAPERATGLSRP